MAGLTSIREVAALSNPTRVAYQLNKETFFFYQIMLYYKDYSELNLYSHKVDRNTNLQLFINKIY